ncbi:MAG: Pr6Pr family membrane protein, partial [Aquiluna sp.]
MLYRSAFGAFRVLLGLSLLGSVVWQVADRIRVDRFRPFEYFAFFSIDSSIFAGIVVLLSGIWLLQGKAETERQNILRLIVTVSMIIVGVVYHALLGDSAVAPEDIGYEWPRIPNLVIHTWAPIAIAVDYLLSIRGAKPKLRKALWVVVYPLIWLFLSIIRGLADGWGPYWVINPGSEG